MCSTRVAHCYLRDVVHPCLPQEQIASSMLEFILNAETELAYAIEQRVMVSDFEGNVWQCTTRRKEDRLTVDSNVDTTCYLHLPWLTRTGTELMLSTATLLVRDRPYFLPLELARGTLNRLLNHIANWQAAGYEFPEAITEQLQACKHIFIRALYRHESEEERVLAAKVALDEIIELQLNAVPSITSVLIDSRGDKPQVNTLLAGTMPKTFADEPSTGGDAFEAAFDTALLTVRWRDIQPTQNTFDWTIPDNQLTWCQERHMRTVAGPLMQLTPEALPEWLYEIENDSHQILKVANNFIRGATTQYGSKVNLWYAASGMNMSTALGINEESRLRLTAACVEAIREVDPQTPVMVGFDQPWGEYLGSGNHDFAPIEFADTLIRAGLGIAAIGLELNFDVWPHGTTRRDVFTLLEQLNRWSQFQLPLVLMITAPSQASEASGDSCVSAVTYRATPEHQARLIRDIVPLLQAHPVVQGVVWNQFYDSDEYGFPFTGMVDVVGKPKAGLESWTSLRQNGSGA